MFKFSYCGPIEKFGRCIENNWRGETMAPTDKKARSNLAFQYKKQAGLQPGARITLPGKIVKEQTA